MYDAIFYSRAKAEVIQAVMALAGRNNRLIKKFKIAGVEAWEWQNRKDGEQERP